jgi:hypothetical protein
MTNTRRRVLGLIAAIAGASRLSPFSDVAFAAKRDCYASKSFGPWKGIATDTQAGARIGQIAFENPDECKLRAEMQVAPSYDAKLVLFGGPDSIALPKDFLVNPDNRLIARGEDGKVVVDEVLCGVCTEIRDDKVSIVLPLAMVPLFREATSIEMAVKLGAKECRFKLDCANLRQALTWAGKRRDALARSADDKKCTPPPEGCFITTACCEALGLGDDCFELTALRRYRDQVLAPMPQGRQAIADYYRLAPQLLERMPATERRQRMMRLYFRYVLPSALAASLRFNRLAYRLYAGMMAGLMRDYGFKPDKSAANDRADNITVKQKPRLCPNQAPLAD